MKGSGGVGTADYSMAVTDTVNVTVKESDIETFGTHSNAFFTVKAD